MFSIARTHTVHLLCLAIIVFFCVAAPGFASWTNLFNLLRQTAILGIVAAGMTPVIIAGQIDLSVGSVISFASCCTALLLSHAGMPPLAAFCIALLIGMGAICLNGAIVLLTGMPSMLCTLATMSVWQGLCYVVTNGAPISGLPEGMRLVGQGYLGPVPIPVVILVAVFVAVGFLLSRTYPGRHIYAVGSSPEAARLSGVSVSRTTLLAFAVCGILVGLASFVQTSRLFGGFPTAGIGIELQVVTAVVVGGVSFAGGRGKLSGVLAGVLVMGVLANGMSIMGVGSYVQMVCSGLVLLTVVGLDCFQRTKAKPRKAVEGKSGEASGPVDVLKGEVR